MFSWFKRNKVRNERHNKKYISKIKEIKSKILELKSLSDYDLNFIYHEMNENDKYDLIKTYDETLTFIISNYLQKE